MLDAAVGVDVSAVVGVGSGHHTPLGYEGGAGATKRRRASLLPYVPTASTIPPEPAGLPDSNGILAHTRAS